MNDDLNLKRMERFCRRGRRGILRHIIRGCGTLPHCGPHPGTLSLFGLPLMAFVVLVLKIDLPHACFGAGLFFLMILPAYFLGAYMRSETEESLQRNWEREHGL